MMSTSIPKGGPKEPVTISNVYFTHTINESAILVQLNLEQLGSLNILLITKLKQNFGLAVDDLAIHLQQPKSNFGDGLIASLYWTLLVIQGRLM